MKLEFNSKQERIVAECDEFVKANIAPFAAEYDRQESIPANLISELAAKKYLTPLLPKEYKCRDLDMISYGLLHESISRGSSSVSSLLTVHMMVAFAINRWGTPKQKTMWLPGLARGELVAAFALTEPETGSDAREIETTAELVSDYFVLNGNKKWITFGQRADLFLVLAKCGGRHTAILVPRDCPGLRITPISGMLGLKASMLSEISMEKCYVPKDNMLAQIGFGFSHVVSSALSVGRYGVAWGCAGITKGCLDACLEYTMKRKQFQKPLRKHQLVSEMISDMVVNYRAARLMCCQAGYLWDKKEPNAVMAILAAKYFGSGAAMKAAKDAVQIHGANGCSSDSSVQRYFRDSKIMEIIEGTSQIQQLLIADLAFKEYGAL